MALVGGGMYEVDALMALMTLTAVRDLTALPGAVAKLERNYRLYERRSGRPFPEEFKALAFLKLLPKSYEAEIKWRLASGMVDYGALKESIASYSQHIRSEGSFKRGDNDMDASLLEQKRAD